MARQSLARWRHVDNRQYSYVYIWLVDAPLVLVNVLYMLLGT